MSAIDELMPLLAVAEPTVTDDALVERGGALPNPQVVPKPNRFPEIEDSTDMKLSAVSTNGGPVSLSMSRGLACRPDDDGNVGGESGATVASWIGGPACSGCDWTGTSVGSTMPCDSVDLSEVGKDGFCGAGGTMVLTPS